MKTKKINEFFSTLNFILIFVGYELVTSIFLPVTSDIEGISKLVTVPYRGLALLLALLVILLNKLNKIKFTIPIKILFMYWSLLIFRISYDFYFTSNIHIDNTEKVRLWLFIFGIILIPAYSVIKSHKYINYDIALKWIFGLTIFSIALSLLSNEIFLEMSTERAEGNVGMNTINTGHLGVTGILLSLFIYFKSNKSFLFKAFISFSIIVSSLILLRAGSRGPLIALLIVLLIWLGSHGKNRLRNIIIISISGISLLIFFDLILDLISQISPVMALRLEQSNPFESRLPLYKTAIISFIENPFLGKQFAIFHSGGFIYAHNIILDSLMGLGFLGGTLMVYLIFKILSTSSKLIAASDPRFWVGLILIQFIIKGMLSGSFYYSALITILFPLILFFKKENLY